MQSTGRRTRAMILEGVLVFLALVIVISADAHRGGFDPVLALRNLLRSIAVLASAAGVMMVILAAQRLRER